MNESKEERLIRQLETDPEYFIEVFLERELSPKQKLLLKKALTCKHILALWSRQTGKSTVIASFILWLLLYGKGQIVQKEHINEKIAIVAPIKDQHVMIYEKIETLVNRSDYISSFIVKINTEQIVMKNGNMAKFMSASPGSHIRGFTATCIVIDESQDITDAKYSGDVLPFGATTNALVLEAGTPKTKNHFYRAMNSKQVTVVGQKWFECPFLSEEYVMGQKQISPDALWRQEYLCFHPDTYIMSEIPKKIKSIKKNDKVFNNEGKLINVKGILKRKTSEEVLKITIWNGNNFICTKEHPIYSSIRTGVKNHSREVLKFNKAENLQSGDFIHYPKLYENKIRHKHSKEELRLFGLWVAEGSVGAKNRTLQFSLGSHEKNLIKEVQNSILKLYGKNSTLHLRNKTGSSTQIYINSVDLVKKYTSWFGKGASNKKIPDFVYRLSKQEIAWFLSGYYDGDGHDSKKKFGCSSISKLLIENINTLLLKYNIYSKISCVRFKEEKKIIMSRECIVRPKWQLQTSGVSYNRMKDLFNENNERKCFSKFIECEKHDLLQIKKIEKIQYTGHVYNLETDANNTYLTEIGSVHNCEFVEEGVLAFPSALFEPEIDKVTGAQTGRWNLEEYSYISQIEGLTKEKVDEITKLIKEEGATYTSGLDLGKQNDNTVYVIFRDDIRPIKIEVMITFPLKTKYSKIAQVIGMFYKYYSPYEFNIDYTNEKGFVERLIENNVPVVMDPKMVRGAIQFTNKNKSEMVNSTRVLLENFQLSLPKSAEELIKQFLNQQFELNDQQKPKFFHPSNENDDALWATLLALKNITIATSEEITSFVNPWDRHDDKIHGANRKTPKEVAYVAQSYRERDRYKFAEQRRGLRG